MEKETACGGEEKLFLPQSLDQGIFNNNSGIGIGGDKTEAKDDCNNGNESRDPKTDEEYWETMRRVHRVAMMNIA